MAGTLLPIYDDFVAGMRDLFENEQPTKEMINNITEDVMCAASNQNPYKVLAVLTQVTKGLQAARDMAVQAVYNQLQGFSPASAEVFNNGKNFTSSGLQVPLVFRDAVDVDYNYAANDDLDASEYGSRNYSAIIADEERWKAKLKLLTKEKNLRQENILYEHPRMQPIAASVKHKLAFLGTWAELQRNAEVS